VASLADVVGLVQQMVATAITQEFADPAAESSLFRDDAARQAACLRPSKSHVSGTYPVPDICRRLNSELGSGYTTEGSDDHRSW